MDLPQETEDYIRESIDQAVGLPVPSETLLLKLRAVEASNVHLRHQYLSLQTKLKEKDEIIERSRAEANMNAVALKKFVEENQKLAADCANLLASRNKWERECSLYERDRVALMDFADEVDERAKEAESRNRDLEEENKKLMEELEFYKLRSTGQLVDVSSDDTQEEQILLDSLLATMFGKDEISPTVHSFLDANAGVEVFRKLLTNWTSLRPSTQKVVALAAEVKSLERDKDHLTNNLRTAEEEVNVLFQENNILNLEIKRLMRQCFKEKHIGGSGGSSASGKVKRKSMSSSPVDRKIEFGDADVQRQPLSPLQSNSPDQSRTHK